MRGKLTDPIPVNNEITQADSLSPLLFNVTMDKVIRKVCDRRGYKLGRKEMKILCYTNDAVLIAE